MSQFYYLNEEILGSCHLAVGEKNTVLFDPGMAWYGEKTVENIKAIIGDRPIDAVFLTHSHYDHVGALPIIKKYWPDAMVFGAAYAGRVFSKLSAKRLIRELSASAAELNGTTLPDDYSTRSIQLDQMLIGGETINVGDVCVQSIKTVGHTKDCLSYLVDGQDLLASETIGSINTKEDYMPQFLVSCEEAIKSIDSCKNSGAKKLWLTHHGEVGEATQELWQWFEEGLTSAKGKILEIIRDNGTPEAQLKAMEETFWRPEKTGGWPQKAFDLNAESMLKTIKSENFLSHSAFTKKGE